MKLLDLLDRIYSVMERLDENHPNVKKVNKILSTAEKALLAWAKIIWIKLNDIVEIKWNKTNSDEDVAEEDEEGWEKKEEETIEDEDNEDDTDLDSSDEHKNISWFDLKKWWLNDDWSDDGKRIKIKAMFWSLPPEKQTSFKNKMWNKFNSLGL